VETYQTKHFKAYPNTEDSYWLEFCNGVKSLDIFMLEDGFWYYFSEGKGASGSYCLREISDILDMMNKEWNDQVNAYFENNPDATQHEATDQSTTEAF